jgi:hypothetical protein
MGVNYTEKSFMKLNPGVNFIKLFCHNLHCYHCIALGFDSGYAATGVNYTEKSFMKLTPGRATNVSSGVNVTNLFFITGAMAE